MASAITIAVKTSVIKTQAEKMRQLARRINSRSYVLDFEQGEGKFVGELKELAAELKGVGTALGTLASVTAERLDSAAAEFTAADEKTAGFYRRGE